MNKSRGGRIWMILLAAVLLAAMPLSPAYSAGGGVYHAQLDGEISEYMVDYLARAYNEAEAAGAEAMILELDTFGGYVSSAVSLKQLIMEANIPTYCYINDKAISAGSLIALSCDKIVIKNSGSIGAAEPRIGGQKADEKVVSFWTAQLSGAAEEHGRNTRLASAMSDSSVVIEGLSEEGRLLTLTSAQALQYGMADFVVASDAEAYQVLGVPPADVVNIDYNFQETASRLLSNSVISTVLLSVGIGGLVLEIFFAGTGVFAAVGVVALAMYFIGALLLSYTAWIAVALAFAGFMLLVMEIFVIPGFGVCGVLGIASIVGAVICVAPSFTVALIQLGVALLTTVVLVLLSLKCGRTRRVWNKLILRESTSTEEGYISQPVDINRLIGKTGVALTDLRPSGAAKIDDKRTDVLADGAFIKRGTAVKVIKVEGSSVVVAELSEDSAAAD